MSMPETSTPVLSQYEFPVFLSIVEHHVGSSGQFVSNHAGNLSNLRARHWRFWVDSLRNRLAIALIWESKYCDF